jgi:RNA polymerase sigma factor (sigma-70 family)
MSMPSSPTDLDLVRGLHARDRKAFARVYGDYHAAVYNLCARILGDSEEAKDVTQDVFLKAFSRPPAATTEVRLRPWLYRVATNACLNLVRGRRPGGPVEAEALPASGDPYEQAHSAELIERSLAGINDRYRAALVLRDLHGLNGSELAEAMDVTRPAADVLVHRARASFRRVFTDLAGESATAPANLALSLPVLSVPAALRTMPLPAMTDPSIAGPLVAGAGTGAASSAGPGAGILAKIAAALSTKAAVVAAGAAVVAGGGLTAVQLADDDAGPASAGGGAASLATGHRGDAHSGSPSPHEDRDEHRRAIQHHLEEAHRAGVGAHAGSTHADGSAHDQAAGAGGRSSTSHDTTGTHDAPTSSPPTTSTRGGHGDTGHDTGGDE